MACRGDRHTRPLGCAPRGRVGSASYVLQFNPPVEPEERLLMLLIVVFGSVHTQGPSYCLLQTLVEKNCIVLRASNVESHRFLPLVRLKPAEF